MDTVPTLAPRTIEEPQGNHCLCIYRGFMMVMRGIACSVTWEENIEGNQELGRMHVPPRLEQRSAAQLNS